MDLEDIQGILPEMHEVGTMEYNFRVYNHDLRAHCGHMHHSRESAKGCMEHLGWPLDRCVIFRVKQGQDDTAREKQSLHKPKRKFDYVDDNKPKYNVSVDLEIHADSENLAIDRVEKWLNSARSSEDYISHIITDIQEVQE